MRREGVFVGWNDAGEVLIKDDEGRIWACAYENIEPVGAEGEGWRVVPFPGHPAAKMPEEGE